MKPLSTVWCIVLLTVMTPGLGLASAAGTAQTYPLCADGSAGVPVIRLPHGAAEIVLNPADGLTIERLRGLRLDDDPPGANDPRRVPSPDDRRPAYVARDVSPFRLRHLDVEFHYDGYDAGIPAMYDYVARHGVNRLGAYLRGPGDVAHTPDHVTWVLLTSYSWNRWFRERSIPYGHWHRLAEATDNGEDLVPADHFKRRDGYELVMMDQEFGGLLPPHALRETPWFPGEADEAAQQDFMARYYRGYTLAYTVPGQALRAAGWPVISMYGWKPVERTWLGFGFSWPEGDPYGDRFFQAVYDGYDIHHPDIYCWRWTPRNVAWVLWNIDTVVAYARQQPDIKPIRPYLSTSILVDPKRRPAIRAHPLPVEDVRAMFVLAFFSGIDGLVQWNWANRWNHHAPPVLDALGKDAYMPHTLMVGRPFSAHPADRPRWQRRWRRPATFTRYDFLRLVDLDQASGLARFQRLDPDRINEIATLDDVPDDRPVFSLPAAELRAHLRPFTETVAAMVEGLALLKPVESLIRDGIPMIDVPARQQYEQGLPVIRRIRHGRTHLIAAYDPFPVTSPRRVTLNNFDGIDGRTLHIPADRNIRLFLLQEDPP